MRKDPKTKKDKLDYDDATNAVIEDVEARIKTLILSLGGGAGTQNIDRILRLPGTTNLPNAKKLRDGRVACQTRLLTYNDVSYPLQSFPVPAHQDEDRGPDPDQGDRTQQSKRSIIDWTKVEEHAGWLRSVADLPTDFSDKGKAIVSHVGSLKELNFDLKESGLIERPYDSWSQVTLALATIFKVDGRFTDE
jgi:hypothetical protein